MAQHHRRIDILGREQLVVREPRHLADVVPRARDIPQQGQALDVVLRIETVVGRRALRFDGVVALFPNPNDMGAQTGQARRQLDRMMCVGHILNKNYT